MDYQYQFPQKIITENDKLLFQLHNIQFSWSRSFQSQVQVSPNVKLRSNCVQKLQANSSPVTGELLVKEMGERMQMMTNDENDNSDDDIDDAMEWGEHITWEVGPAYLVAFLQQTKKKCKH